MDRQAGSHTAAQYSKAVASCIELYVFDFKHQIWLIQIGTNSSGSSFTFISFSNGCNI